MEFEDGEGVLKIDGMVPCAQRLLEKAYPVPLLTRRRAVAESDELVLDHGAECPDSRIRALVKDEL